jgi:hypothetical protein
MAISYSARRVRGKRKTPCPAITQGDPLCYQMIGAKVSG